MRVAIGELSLNCTWWGDRWAPETLVFIHGNLACADWFELAAQYLPADLRVVGIDWRGCGESDKPAPAADYSNYTIAQHAEDMLAVLRALDIPRCHLATHSTGGIIGTHMLLREPQRFGKVVALAPVGPMGLRFPDDSDVFFRIMKASREKTMKGLALTAPTLFRPESLAAGEAAVYAPHTGAAQRRLFDRLVDKAFAVSDGIWFGTPATLNRAWETGGLRSYMASIAHPHLVLWGTLDPFIPRADMEEMAATMPHCRLVVVPDVGHSLLVEKPELCARYLAQFLAERG
jgi:pimeloyl-ACP methyl ester carboxylesterase